MSLESRVGCATFGTRALKFYLLGLILCGLFGLMRGVTVCGGNSVRVASALMKEVQVAVLNFRVEYDRWPRLLNVRGSESPMELSRGALAALLNFPEPEAEWDNSKRITTWEFRKYRKNVDGVLMEDGIPSKFLDPWRSPFLILVDANGDGKIPNPEAAAPENMRFDRMAPSKLPLSVIIFSAGPDRDPDSWTDNITSWR